MEKRSGSKAGDTGIDRLLYKYLLQWLPEKPLEILNLGSGTGFALERLLNRKRRYADRITCVDLAEWGGGSRMPELPWNVTYLGGCDLEKPLNLNRRFDLVCCFECIEHVDETDILLDNCIRHMKEDGLLAISTPNLASIYGRLLLLAGYQPYILEISNRSSIYGQGRVGRINNPGGKPIHHIRGITCRAMKEMLADNGLSLLKCYGSLRPAGGLFKHLPSLAGDVLYLCKKT